MKKYQSYKPSCVEWIEDIPEMWEVGKLKHNSELKISSVDKHIFEDELSVNVCNYTDIYYNEFITSNLDFKIGSCTTDEYEKFKLENGDVIITKDSETPDDIGIPSLVVEELNNVVCGYHLSVIKPNTNKLLGSYLFRQLQTKRVRNYFEINSNGITRFGLGKSSVLDTPLILPPINEQHQIVQFLDSKTELIDKLISTKERKITLLKEQRTSLINQVVTKGLNPNIKMKDSGVEWIGEIPEGWRIGRLGYYSNVYRGSGYQYLNQVDDDFDGRKERVVRISDISEFNPIWCEYLEQFENYRIKKDEILMGGTGHYFGKSIYVTEEMEGLIHSYNIIRIVVKNLNTKYIQYYISSQRIREQMDMSVLGSGQPFIDLQGLKDLIILIPENKEQSHIVEFLDSKTKEIDDLVQLEQKKIDLLKEYRQSLISEVVTGKIKVTN